MKEESDPLSMKAQQRMFRSPFRNNTGITFNATPREYVLPDANCGTVDGEIWFEATVNTLSAVDDSGCNK
jgi:hypothetical protein